MKAQNLEPTRRTLAEDQDEMGKEMAIKLRKDRFDAENEEFEEDDIDETNEGENNGDLSKFLADLSSFVKIDPC